MHFTVTGGRPDHAVVQRTGTVRDKHLVGHGKTATFEDSCRTRRRSGAADPALTRSPQMLGCSELRANAIAAQVLYSSLKGTTPKQPWHPYHPSNRREIFEGLSRSRYTSGNCSNGGSRAGLSRRKNDPGPS